MAANHILPTLRFRSDKQGPFPCFDESAIFSTNRRAFRLENVEMTGRIGWQLEAAIRFARAGLADYASPVSTITAVLEPDAEGYLHLAAPAELRSSKVKIVATLEAVDAARPQAGSKLKALLSSGRTLDKASATARIAEVYEDREAWRSQ